MEQPFDDVDEIYNQKLAVVANFFTSKLQLYYSIFPESINPTINGGTFQGHNYEATIGMSEVNEESQCLMTVT
jgi:hypothetical protein